MFESLSVLAFYLAARQRRFTDRAELEAWQQRRLRRHLARTRRRFALYRGVAEPRLEAFPVIDKAGFLDRFAELNVGGLSLEACLAQVEQEGDRACLQGLSIGLSTGTSGRRGAFLTAPSERRRWAGALLAKVFPDGLGAPAGGHRVALFLRSGGPLYDTVGASRRLCFRYFDLRRPFAELTAALERFAPTLLAAPSRVLRLLAEARAAGALRLAPHRIWNVAEVLDSDDRAVVAGTFGVPVGEIYQATEGFLGISCPLGTLHLNEDLVAFERQPLPDGRFIPVVTDLFRQSQAIIRYRLDDVVLPAREPCACGSPLVAIERIEGRADDLWMVPAAGDRPVPLFADYVRSAVLGADPAIDDFRACQEAPEGVRLSLAVRPGADAGAAFAAATRAIEGLFATRGSALPAVLPERWVAEPPELKQRRVRRSFAVSPRAFLQ